MTTLDEVRARATSPVTDIPGSLCHEDRRFLLSEVDRLQSELSALKQALKDARPAIEAGVTVFERDADNRNDEKSPFTQWCRRCAAQLRGLLSLSEP